ncbi:integration host factor subunit alpha [Geomesophilobacter sediminis]|uniref:Integration host factor subunit alpha n=1 Tax=Geomesophilobacter sediminis TaxID=2798584 RepID=A0A8J7LY24_9BACT|nr:integration host factor subunit alpha [Geomesophilobacter sediminis]MBJ6724171.1 integration host factor subunit alpha [Geomesophilobacter sediminis]
MTKADLVERIVEKTGMTKAESFEVFEHLMETLKETLASGESVKIQGFGRFEVREKAPRNGRNPQTGEPITLDARKVLSFKPSQVLKLSLNKVT